MSVRAVVFDSVLRRAIRPSHLDVRAEMERRRRDGQPMPAAVPPGVRRRFDVTEEVVPHGRVVTLRQGGRRVLVCVPGGGYVHPVTTAHWRTASQLARAADLDLVVPLYEVAPAGDAEAAHALMSDVLATARAGWGDGAVILAGDSAGAGLALAAAQRCSEGLRTILLMNPWLDVELSDPAFAALAPHDVILDARRLREGGAVWAGELDTSDPRVSPLRGSFEDLPPVHIVTGGRDLLLLDALAARRRLVEAGNRGTLTYLPDGNHAVGFLGSVIPEGRQARRAAVRALRG